MKLFTISVLFFLSSFFMPGDVKMKIDHSLTIDSLGACQGVSYQHKNVFLYGDREVGMIREFALNSDSVIYLNNQCKLTIGGKN